MRRSNAVSSARLWRKWIFRSGEVPQVEVIVERRKDESSLESADGRIITFKGSTVEVVDGVWREEIEGGDTHEVDASSE